MCGADELSFKKYHKLLQICMIVAKFGVMWYILSGFSIGINDIFPIRRKELP
jgi:hypothetical protein